MIPQPAVGNTGSRSGADLLSEQSDLPVRRDPVASRCESAAL